MVADRIRMATHRAGCVRSNGERTGRTGRALVLQMFSIKGHGVTTATFTGAVPAGNARASEELAALLHVALNLVLI